MYYSIISSFLDRKKSPFSCCCSRRLVWHKNTTKWQEKIWHLETVRGARLLCMVQKISNASQSVSWSVGLTLYSIKYTLLTTMYQRVTHIAQQIESKPHPRQMLKVSCMPHYTLNQFNEDINAIWQGYWTVDNLFTLCVPPKFEMHVRKTYLHFMTGLAQHLYCFFLFRYHFMYLSICYQIITLSNCHSLPCKKN